MDPLMIEALKPACQITVTLIDNQSRKQVPLKLKDGQTVMVPLFQSQDNIVGKISVEPVVRGEKVEHNGIKVELLGQIEMLSDRSKDYDFITHVCELDVPGDIYDFRTYPFVFSAVEMLDDTYHGVKVNLRYILKATMSTISGGSIVEDQEFVVCNCCPAPSINDPIEMEFRTDDDLFHVEVEFDKNKYHLKDVISGKIHFHSLIKTMKIEGMNIEFKRRESTFSEAMLSSNFITGGIGDYEPDEKTTLAKIVLKDGAPVIGESESIPIEILLSQYELTPTYLRIHNRFSVKYYLKLVIATDVGPETLEKTDITLYRLRDMP